MLAQLPYAFSWENVFWIFVIALLMVTASAAVQIVASNRQADRIEGAVGNLHTLLNSRLSALLEETARASRLQGAEDERSDERDRVERLTHNDDV